MLMTLLMQMLLMRIMICYVDDPYADENDGRHGNRTSNDATRADSDDLIIPVECMLLDCC
jgi:hypothetical protein